MNDTDARSLLARLLRRIAPDADLANAADDDLIQDALDLDSMDFLELVSGVHDATGIDIPERDYPRLASIGGFVGYLAER